MGVPHALRPGIRVTIKARTMDSKKDENTIFVRGVAHAVNEDQVSPHSGTKRDEAWAMND